VYLAEVLEARVQSDATPLTFKRLLKLAPVERLQEMKQDFERDIEVDRAEILEWRRQRGEAAN
jgi:hypothetical protein